MGIEIRPRILFDRQLPATPKVSLILLDWCVRESFHIFDYLARQDLPRSQFEVLWIEYYDRAPHEIADRIDASRDRGDVPPVDRWIQMNMPRSAYYHKHLMYNVGVLASRGALVMIGDSDAMVGPTFVRALIRAFDDDQNIVLHLDEVRSHSRRFYPFNHPTLEQVIAEGCVNWSGGKTTGLLDTVDTLHSRNYGACICARREDVLAIGGADEHVEYLGHVCGPYDLTWRLVNFGRREVWHQSEFLWHVWHPGSDGDENYLGPHDGRNVSTVALETRRTGRVLPLVENPIIRLAREAQQSLPDDLYELVFSTIGDRALTDWTIDDYKRAVSAGRRAWSAHQYAEAVRLWEPVLEARTPPAQLWFDIGWSYYFIGQYADAERAFISGLDREPHNPSGQRGLAWTLFVKREYRAAIRHFDKAVAGSDPLDPGPLHEAYRGRGWARFHIRQFAAAAEDFTRAIRAIAGAGHLGSIQDPHRGLGWIGIAIDDDVSAAEHFTAALTGLGDRRGPEYENAVTGLAKARERIASREAMAARVDETILSNADGVPETDSFSPRSVRATLICELAASYAAAGNHREAYRHFKAALALDPANMRATSGLGWSALHINRLSIAQTTFKRMVAKARGDRSSRCDALHGLASVAYRQGRMHDAITLFKRALKTTDAATERAEVRRITSGLQRACYVAGRPNVTLAKIAHTERTSRVGVALSLGGRAIGSRLLSVLYPRRPH